MYIYAYKCMTCKIISIFFLLINIKRKGMIQWNIHKCCCLLKVFNWSEKKESEREEKKRKVKDVILYWYLEKQKKMCQVYTIFFLYNTLHNSIMKQNWICMMVHCKEIINTLFFYSNLKYNQYSSDFIDEYIFISYYFIDHWSRKRDKSYWFFFVLYILYDR